MVKDQVISALIGLVGACNNNPKTTNTDMVVLKAFVLLSDSSGCDDKALQEIINEIYAEKNTIAPGCAVCEMPCGNTSDYDMERIYQAEEGIRNVKLDILKELKELAASSSLKAGQKEIGEEIMGSFYKALSYVSYDMEEKPLRTLLEEIKELKKNAI